MGQAKKPWSAVGRYAPDRLWIRPGSSRVVYAIDSIEYGGAPVREYQWKVGNNWRHWMTGLRPDDSRCAVQQVLTQLGLKSWHGRTWRHYTTVVDCTGWRTRAGKRVRFELTLMGPDRDGVAMWGDEQANHGDATGCLYRLSRREGDRKHPVGDALEFMREADPYAVFEEARYKGRKLSEWWDEAEQDAEAHKRLGQVFQLECNVEGELERKVVPFNYAALLTPPTVEEVEVLLESYEPPSWAYAKEAPASPEPGQARQNVFAADNFSGGEGASYVSDDFHL